MNVVEAKRRVVDVGSDGVGLLAAAASTNAAAAAASASVKYDDVRNDDDNGRYRRYTQPSSPSIED